MSKIVNHYENNVDKAWYESSNIVYSECLDHENELKTLTVVFASGAKYKYSDVDVMDYLRFREASSQGSAFDTYIKKKGYAYEKLEKVDVGLLKEECEKYSTNLLTIEIGGDLKVIDSSGEVKYQTPEFVSSKTVELLKGVLESLGYNVKVVEK